MTKHFVILVNENDICWQGDMQKQEERCEI